MNDVTQLLVKMDSGDSRAAELLMPLVYDELRKLAAKQIDNERPGQTLQATALVHEAYLRLVDIDYSQQWHSRRHFYGAAAEAMRRILIDRARRRNREKHGGHLQQITVNVDLLPMESSDDQLEVLDEALDRFSTVDASACELVKLRYFAGFPLREAAEILDIPERTADRLWSFAKAWLLREIRQDDPPS
ncbi:MAG: sigma-70 family RNA polymerase sigma factor [Planctomycetaceae bacterium]|nr:sigma-70 family RNA polymerase sigma factor [Planctomycetaceae bacterium]